MTAHALSAPLAAVSARVRGASIALLTLVLACAMDVQTIRYPEAADVPPRPEGCKVRVLDWHRGPSSCRELGDVYVGDPGWNLVCRREATERLVLAEACRVGADTVLLRRVEDRSSACFEARARLLRCAAAESASAP